MKLIIKIKKILMPALVVILILITGCSNNVKKECQKDDSLAKVSKSSTNSVVEENYSTDMENLYFGNGLVAATSDDIYSIIGPGQFFKTKIGNTDMKRLLTSEKQEGYNYANINVIGDWIYFLNKTNNSLYKVGDDYANPKLISNNILKYLIYKGSIYFISSDNFSICKMNINGEQRCRIVDGSKNHITDIFIDNNLIYFNQGSEYYRFQVNTDGTNLQITGFPTNSFISQEWAYYTEYDAKLKINLLYRKNVKNNNKELLFDKNILAYTKYNNNIYYITNSNISPEYFVNELNLDTKTNQKIFKTTVAGLSYINCTDNYIFLSGTAVESHYTDMVRIPINDYKAVAVEERFVLNDLKWENVELDPKYR